MKQTVHAVLYTKPHCIQCKMSTKLMDEWINVNKVDTKRADT
ncbi:hypothetical protein [Enterococcus faecalis]|nr:hypothetical protein [Enterococcus faecalis]